MGWILRVREIEAGQIRIIPVIAAEGVAYYPNDLAGYERLP